MVASRPERTTMRLARTERPDLKSERPGMRSERPERPARPVGSDFRSDLRQKSPCVLQDFVPFGAAAQKLNNLLCLFLLNQRLGQ